MIKRYPDDYPFERGFGRVLKWVFWILLIWLGLIMYNECGLNEFERQRFQEDPIHYPRQERF